MRKKALKSYVLISPKSSVPLLIATIVRNWNFEYNSLYGELIRNYRLYVSQTFVTRGLWILKLITYNVLKIRYEISNKHFFLKLLKSFKAVLKIKYLKLIYKAKTLLRNLINEYRNSVITSMHFNTRIKAVLYMSPQNTFLPLFNSLPKKYITRPITVTPPSCYSALSKVVKQSSTITAIQESSLATFVFAGPRPRSCCIETNGSRPLELLYSNGTRSSTRNLS